MSEISEQDLKEFCEKLNGLRSDLQPHPAQLALLEKILSIAWNATAPEASLSAGFTDCFDPDQAALISDYQPGGPRVLIGGEPEKLIKGGPVSMIPRLIRGLIK
jgi:hypothetical protein